MHTAGIWISFRRKLPTFVILGEFHPLDFDQSHPSPNSSLAHLSIPYPIHFAPSFSFKPIQLHAVSVLLDVSVH